MNKHRVLEIFCVVFLVIFIFVISYEGAYTDKTAKEIAKEVTSVVDVSELTSVNKRKIKQDFGIDFSQVESFVYYASESIMTVDELMIIKLNEGVNAESITETIEKRVQEKQVLFDGYAPEQSALLKNYIIDFDSGVIFYAVGQSATEAHQAFRAAVR